MRHFKVIFIKTSRVLGPASQVVEMAEQHIYTDAEKLEVNVPGGYALVNVIELLPDITIKNGKNEKKISSN